MQSITDSIVSLIRNSWKFVLGALCGAVLASFVLRSEAAQEDRQGRSQSVLYAIAGLAVDTEKNAARIEQLQERVADLEHALEQLAAAKN